MKLTDEIKALLDSDRIDTEAALRLMLVSQAEILERLTTVERVTNGNAEYQKLYPSVIWYWSHQRKTLIIVAIMIFLTLYLLLTPITFYEIRTGILEAMGIPISSPTTPIP